MNDDKQYDAIIIGGSFSGLSAGMALGRGFRKVLIIDAGEPCNKQTPHAHNFITHDGEKPAEIASKSKQQVLQYPTVEFLNDKVISATRTGGRFTITTMNEKNYSAKKLLLSTGIKDILTGIEGLKECWGISALHCPYCHGYEVHNKPLAVIANGELAYHFIKLIDNWTKDLVLLTNGKSTLTPEQLDKIRSHNISVKENEIDRIEHKEGYMSAVIFKDGSTQNLSAVFIRPPFEHVTDLHKQLGCELTETGLIKTDMFQSTNVPGVYAAGDNCHMARALSVAIATGNVAGARMNNEIIEEEF